MRLAGLTQKAIEKALEEDTAPDSAELRDILNKSLDTATPMDETVALLCVQDKRGHWPHYGCCR